jgi:hypothetical protein
MPDTSKAVEVSAMLLKFRACADGVRAVNLVAPERFVVLRSTRPAAMLLRIIVSTESEVGA